VLLAVMASMYAVYHGPEGLRRIALRTNFMARLLVASVRGVRVATPAFFDTVMLEVPSADVVRARAEMKRINLRYIDATRVAVSFDETTNVFSTEQLSVCIRFVNDMGAPKGHFIGFFNTLQELCGPSSSRSDEPKDSGFIDF